MATWFTRLTIGALALASFSLNSCQKDETKVTLNASAAPKLASSTATPDLVLTTANVNTAGAAFTYTAADYGYQAAVTYTLQLDKKGGNFSAPQSFPAGNSAGTLTLTKAQLTSAFLALGIAPGTANAQVDARVVATVGTVSQISPVVTLTGTPTPICTPNTLGDWGIVGPAADGWPGATATDRSLTYDCYTQTFKLRTTLTAGAFKFRANRDWGTNLGGVTGNYANGIALTTNGPDLVATPGTYNVTLTLTTDATGKVTGGNLKMVP